MRKSKLDREVLDPMRARLSHYQTALRDLVIGDVPRAGARIRVCVKAGEFGDHERVEATVLRPLGAFPLVIQRERDSVDLYPLDDWSAARENEPQALRILKERTLVVLRRAVAADTDQQASL